MTGGELPTSEYRFRICIRWLWRLGIIDALSNRPALGGFNDFVHKQK